MIRRGLPLLLAAALVLSGCTANQKPMPQGKEAQDMETAGQSSDTSGEESMYMDTTEHVIYLAGGCFWGMEQLLKRSFRPEFLNRLDEIVFYKPLTKENIVKIIDLQMDALNARLADKQLRCELTPEAKQFIIDAAYDPQYGARPLRRYLQHTVETLLARRIVEGNVSPGATLRVEVRDDALQVV